MPTLFGLTFAGVSLGTVSADLIESLVVGGGSAGTQRIWCAGDANKSGTAYPTRTTPRPMVLTIAGKSGAMTVYNTFNAARQAYTRDTFTATDVEGKTYVGAGYVIEVGDKSILTDSHASFTVTIEPETEWTIT